MSFFQYKKKKQQARDAARAAQALPITIAYTESSSSDTETSMLMDDSEPEIITHHPDIQDLVHDTEDSISDLDLDAATDQRSLEVQVGDTESSTGSIGDLDATTGQLSIEIQVGDTGSIGDLDAATDQLSVEVQVGDTESWTESIGDLKNNINHLDTEDSISVLNLDAATDQTSLEVQVGDAEGGIEGNTKGSTGDLENSTNHLHTEGSISDLDLNAATDQVSLEVQEEDIAGSTEDSTGHLEHNTNHPDPEDDSDDSEGGGVALEAITVHGDIKHYSDDSKDSIGSLEASTDRLKNENWRLKMANNMHFSNFLDSPSIGSSGNVPRLPPSSVTQQHANNNNNNNGNGAGMNGMPMLAGHQADINFLAQKVNELSEQLQQNREKTASVLASAEELAIRAAANGANPSLHESNTAILAARIADLERKLGHEKNKVAILLDEQKENIKLIGEYEQAVGDMVKQTRDFSYNVKSEKIAIAKHYNTMLQDEKDAHLETRLEKDTWHAHFMRANAMIREAHRLRCDEEEIPIRVVAGLQNEVRACRRAIGMDPENFEDEYGYEILKDVPGGAGER